MPDIFNIAANQIQSSPVSSFLEGRQAADIHRRQSADADLAEKRNQILDEEAPLRAKQNEAMSQQIDFDGIKQQLDTTKTILSSVVDEDSYESAIKHIESVDPDLAEKMRGNDYKTMKPIVEKMTGNIDPIRANIEKMSELYTLASDPGNPNREQDAQVFAAYQQIAEYESNKKDAELQKDVDAAAASRSLSASRESTATLNAEKVNTEISKQAKNRAAASGTDKPAPSATAGELKQVTAIISEDPAFTRLDEGQSAKASAWIAGRAKQIQKEKTGLVYADAVELATAEARGKLSTQKVTDKGLIWDSVEDKAVFGEQQNRDLIISQAKEAVEKLGKDPEAVKQMLLDKYGIDDADI